MDSRNQRTEYKNWIKALALVASAWDDYVLLGPTNWDLYAARYLAACSDADAYEEALDQYDLSMMAGVP